MAVNVVAHSRADYAHLLHQLLPFGPAWEKKEIDQLCEGLAVEFERLDQRVASLYAEMDSATVSELVPDWERVMGLPDPCVGPMQSFAERREQVRERLVAVGKQTAEYFVEIARNRGYPNATVYEARAPRCGVARFGRSHFGTWSQQFFWILSTGGRQKQGLRWGFSHWGNRLGSIHGDLLKCVLKRYAPAHSVFSLDFEER